jgi:hypothetical protein
MKEWWPDLSALGTDAITLSMYATEVFQVVTGGFSQLLMLNIS